jgi:hypothetical protein
LLPKTTLSRRNEQKARLPSGAGACCPKKGSYFQKCFRSTIIRFTTEVRNVQRAGLGLLRRAAFSLFFVAFLFVLVFRVEAEKTVRFGASDCSGIFPPKPFAGYNTLFISN